MRDRLAHRGPDDHGEHVDGGVALGFRRLSIIDVEGGHQPMSTEDGRLTVVFNGEIYNHPQLRRELEAGGARYRTRADTESILHLYRRDGVAAFERLDGMFAVALWDASRRELLLARDPVGIKPLYYAFDGKRLAFASELRALLAAGVDDALDHAGVLDYLAYGKAHAPRTVFRHILKLPPGHWLRLGDDGLEIRPYWRLPALARAGRVDAAEAVERLDAILSESVRAAMLSDVPLGAFLSGGVDSSLIAAYMARHAGSRRIATFCVGFEGAEPGLDESRWARLAAAHLGAEHHELMLPADVLDRLEQSIELLDEPIGDCAILPTYLLAKFARGTVKVALTGEGADELFAGYDRYKAAWLNEKIKKLPSPLQPVTAIVARRLGKGEIFSRLPYADARAWADALASATPAQLDTVLHPDFRHNAHRAECTSWMNQFGAMSTLNDALAFDLRTTLADSLLMKVDKSTMRAGLEARVPFLNRPVVDFALGLPAGLKIRLFKGKHLLRRVAARHLPRRLAWRRKHGFWVPWEAWVRRPRNAAISALLADPRFASRGVFDAPRLRLFREELVRGSRDVEAGLFFRIVVFGLWLESLERAPASV